MGDYSSEGYTYAQQNLWLANVSVRLQMTEVSLVYLRRVTVQAR